MIEWKTTMITNKKTCAILIIDFDRYCLHFFEIKLCRELISSKKNINGMKTSLLENKIQGLLRLYWCIFQLHSNYFEKSTKKPRFSQWFKIITILLCLNVGNFLFAIFEKNYPQEHLLTGSSVKYCRSIKYIVTHYI